MSNEPVKEYEEALANWESETTLETISELMTEREDNVS